MFTFFRNGKSCFRPISYRNIHITTALVDELENSILNVRKEYPMLEGVKSLIVRASVIRRLIMLKTPKQSGDPTNV